MFPIISLTFAMTFPMEFSCVCEHVCTHGLRSCNIDFCYKIHTDIVKERCVFFFSFFDFPFMDGHIEVVICAYYIIT